MVRSTRSSARTDRASRRSSRSSPAITSPTRAPRRGPTASRSRSATARRRPMRGIRFVHQDLGLVGLDQHRREPGAHQRLPHRPRPPHQVEGRGRNGAREAHVVPRARRRRREGTRLGCCRRRRRRLSRSPAPWSVWRTAALLVLDEPTATLPGADVHRLFEVIHRLKAARHLHPVRVAPPRRGLRAGRGGDRAPRRPPRRHGAGVAELDHDKLIELIVGHRIDAAASVAAHGQRQPGAWSCATCAAATCTASTSTSTKARSSASPASPDRAASTCSSSSPDRCPAIDGDVLVCTAEIANYEPRSALGAGAAFVPADRGVKGTVAHDERAREPHAVRPVPALRRWPSPPQAGGHRDTRRGSSGCRSRPSRRRPSSPRSAAATSRR